MNTKVNIYTGGYAIPLIIGCGKGADIFISSITEEESTNEGDDITFGAFCASKLTLEIVDLGTNSGLSKLLSLAKKGDAIEVLDDGIDPLFYYYAESISFDKSSRKYTIEAYDKALDFDVDCTEAWNCAISAEDYSFSDLLGDFACTISDKLLFTNIKKLYFFNKSVPSMDLFYDASTKSTMVGSVTKRDVIKWAAACNGVFVRHDIESDQQNQFKFDSYDFDPSNQYDPESGNGQKEPSVVVSYKKETPASGDSKEYTYYLGNTFEGGGYEAARATAAWFCDEENDIGFVFRGSAYESADSVDIENIEVMRIYDNQFMLWPDDYPDTFQNIGDWVRLCAGRLIYRPCKFSIPYTRRNMIRAGDKIMVKTPDEPDGFIVFVTGTKRTNDVLEIESVGSTSRKQGATTFSRTYTAGYRKEAATRRRAAKLEIKTDEIAATVAGKANAEGGTVDSFGWSLTENGFYLDSSGSRVMSVTKDGLSVNGKVTADAGEIGGFQIGNGLSFGKTTEGQYVSINKYGFFATNRTGTPTGLEVQSGKIAIYTDGETIAKLITENDNYNIKIHEISGKKVLVVE